MAATDTSTVPQDGFVNPVDGPFLRFPPFPTAPEGTTIMSFDKFNEGGIHREPGPNDEEVDAYGIPTIPLRVSHKADECKTNTKRKRQAQEAKARKKAGVPLHRTWWEHWEETEVIRRSIGFNPHSSRFERLYAAATDFTNGRTWPVTFASETGPKFIWEKFQRYIGIPVGSIVPQDKKKGAEPKKDDDSDMSDDDMGEDGEGDEYGVASDTRTAAIVRDSEVAALAALARTMASNEEKLSLFFNNPEKSFKMFMSSYARAQGYIWSDANLECMPRVLLYFVNFLLRSKVLPEIERNLRRSVEVITLALTELPSTSSISKVFPDKFSLACTGCWDKKAEGYQQLDLGDNLATLPVPIVKQEKPEPAVLLVESNQTTATDLKEISTSAMTDDAWNTSVSAWGTSDGNNIWVAADTSTEGESTVVNEWLLASSESLCDLLGPTSLPLTHTTGIVERSMRLIKSIHPRNPNPPKSAPQDADASEPDADAVEVDLDRLFMKIVLSPMTPDWDGGETPVYSRPSILDTSKGLVVEDGIPPAATEATTKMPHDPLNDDITLLVESKEANVSLLQVGMSLGGTWVQLTRQGEVAKKKKKGKSKKTIPSYWYLDELAVVAPSFWAVNIESV